MCQPHKRGLAQVISIFAVSRVLQMSLDRYTFKLIHFVADVNRRSTSRPRCSITENAYQSEWMIGADGTIVASQAPIQAIKSLNSAQPVDACSKWSAIPASDS